MTRRSSAAAVIVFPDGPAIGWVIRDSETEYGFFPTFLRTVLFSD